MLLIITLYCLLFELKMMVDIQVITSVNNWNTELEYSLEATDREMDLEVICRGDNWAKGFIIENKRTGPLENLLLTNKQQQQQRMKSQEMRNLPWGTFLDKKAVHYH